MGGGITTSRVLDSANLWTSTGQSAFFDIAAWSLGASLGSLCRTGPRGNGKSGDMWACWVTERWPLCVWQFSRSFLRFWISKDSNRTLAAGCEVDMSKEHHAENNVYNKSFASDRLHKVGWLCCRSVFSCCCRSPDAQWMSEDWQVGLPHRWVNKLSKMPTKSRPWQLSCDTVFWVFCVEQPSSWPNVTVCVLIGCVLYIRYTCFASTTCLQCLLRVN